MNIVIGVDGSEESLAAVEWLAHFSPRLGAAVTAVSAFEMPPIVPMPGGWVPPDEWSEEWRVSLERDLAGAWTGPLRAAETNLTTRVIEGHPPDVLLDVAHDVKADLIVVGSRGRGAVHELFLGSVSHNLSLRAPCPVIIVPHHAHV